MRCMMLFHLKALNIHLEKSNISFGEGGGGAGKFRGYFFIEKGKKNTVAKYTKKVIPMISQNVGKIHVQKYFQEKPDLATITVLKICLYTILNKAKTIKATKYTMYALER